MSKCVLVTGATGFVGSVLCEGLARAGYRVRAAHRTERATPAHVHESVVVGNISGQTQWEHALSGVDCIVHAAARVHMMQDTGANADHYADVNARGTAALAKAAAAAGVRRLIFLSTIKVNGEQTTERPYAASDVPQPSDPYGVSKWLGEQAIREVAEQGRLEYAIVRPPLVYGPGVRANFLRLMRWVDAERWLPLGAVRNQRSLVSVWNLSDLLVNLVSHPAARRNTWMVSDGHDLSTTELIHLLARALERRSHLIPVPVSLLSLAGALAGKRAEVARLCGSLVVDTRPTCSQLGWTPPLAVEAGLARTAAWYRRGAGPLDH